MAQKLAGIIAHLRACIADGSIRTTLIQTEDLAALCDAANAAGELERLSALWIAETRENDRLQAALRKIASCQVADPISFAQDVVFRAKALEGRYHGLKV